MAKTKEIQKESTSARWSARGSEETLAFLSEHSSVRVRGPQLERRSEPTWVGQLELLKVFSWDLALAHQLAPSLEHARGASSALVSGMVLAIRLGMVSAP